MYKIITIAVFIYIPIYLIYITKRELYKCKKEKEYYDFFNNSKEREDWFLGIFFFLGTFFLVCVDEPFRIQNKAVCIVYFIVIGSILLVNLYFLWKINFKYIKKKEKKIILKSLMATILLSAMIFIIGYVGYYEIFKNFIEIRF